MLGCATRPTANQHIRDYPLTRNIADIVESARMTAVDEVPMRNKHVESEQMAQYVLLRNWERIIAF
jgi:hypothetical protein